jgi:ABC-type dipeptide/oligopeptide/nickel transport system permease subunit
MAADTVTTSAPAAARADRLWRTLTSRWSIRVALALCTLLILLAIVGPALAPYNPNVGGPDTLAAPSGAHWMGTDQFGRDVLSRVLAGARVSVFVGVGAVVIGLVPGSLLGMIAGLRGGSWLDSVIMRAMDVILSFPVLVLAAVMSGLTVGQSVRLGPVHVSQVVVVLLVIGLVLVPVFARLTRGEVLAAMQEEYVTAAKVCGTRFWAMITRHLLPNIQGPLVIQAAFSVSIAIVAEAAISFLGLGVQPPQASWGNILGDAQQELLLGGWWLLAFPTVAIALATLGFNLLGDGLREALDPQARAHVRGDQVPLGPAFGDGGRLS